MSSAAVDGHNFSNRSNRFWPVLHLAGFTDVRLEAQEERRLLDYYIAGLVRRGAACPDAGAFVNSYYLCVLQHALKVIGRFNALERQGKSGYAAFIPYAAAQARRMLGLLAASPGEKVKRAKPDFPRLRSAFDVR